MKKLAAVFVIAVLVPAVALAWLATRSLRDQEIVVHSQRALLHQGATDALADDFNIFLDDVRIFYGRLLGDLVDDVGPEELASNYDQILRSRWSQAGVGAAVTDEGDWLCPPVTSTEPEVRRFLRDTQAFLLNAAPSEVYLAPATSANVVTVQELPASSWFENRRIPESKTVAPESAPPTPKTSLTEAGDLPLAKKRKAAPQTEPTDKPSLAMDDANPISLADPSSGSRGARKEEQYVLQQKVAISEDRNRNRSSLLRQSLNGWSQQSDQQLEILPPQPTATGSDSVAPATSPQNGLIASDPQGGETAFSDLQSEDARGQFAAGRTMTPNFNRTRNVTPLGQLDQLREGDQYFQLAKAANDALADNPNRLAWSTLDVNVGQLREIMADDPEGAISRFVSGGLQILLWRRDPAAPGTVFWVQLDLEELKRDLTSIIREAADTMGDAEVSLALLDASGQVVAQTQEGFTTDWRQPFVATEVGEILPHWEVAAYLIDPRAVARSARSARLTLWMLVPILLAAIGVGGLLIIRDIGREMHLARQKTDFVSNVSHELKTPLTSIRMFSDLLGNRADLKDNKRLEYSGIISREAARLSRLINNLLDFSRMERGEKRYQMEQFDIREFISETVESYRHQIESDGFQLHLANLDPAGTPLLVRGDRDAIAQVLVNLLSNAEKYGGAAREIGVEAQLNGKNVEISVLDRGAGVSRKNATRIFDKFFRADDSLSSGIEGSGLGLTLARQIARAHGGDISYQARNEGGSRFSLRLPVFEVDDAHPDSN